MEENLDKNNEVNNEKFDNTTKPNFEEIKEPKLVREIDMNNGNSQSNSATNVGIKMKLILPLNQSQNQKKSSQQRKSLSKSLLIFI